MSTTNFKYAAEPNTYSSFLLLTIMTPFVLFWYQQRQVVVHALLPFIIILLFSFLKKVQTTEVIKRKIKQIKCVIWMNVNKR